MANGINHCRKLKEHCPMLYYISRWHKFLYVLNLCHMLLKTKAFFILGAVTAYQKWVPECTIALVCPALIHVKNVIDMCVLLHQKHVSQAGINNRIPQNTVWSIYLSLPEIPVFGTIVLLSKFIIMHTIWILVPISRGSKWILYLNNRRCMHTCAHVT